MNHHKSTNNLLLQVQQKVVRAGSGPQCAVKAPWKRSMNLGAPKPPVQGEFSLPTRSSFLRSLPLLAMMR